MGLNIALPFALEFSIVTIFGLVLGSFATAMAARIPEERSWIAAEKNENRKAARSACSNCKASLKFYNLIPLFSWIVQRGKCTQCAHKISISYPLIELSTALICIAAYGVYGAALSTLWICLAAPFLVSLFAIDLKYYILPNQLVGILAGIGMIRLLVEFPSIEMSNYVISAILYSALIFMIGKIVTSVLKKEALGLGDVKLFAVCGLWLGLSNLTLFLIFCGVLGVVFGGIWQYLSGKKIFPFGPAIIASFLLLLLGQGFF